MADTAVKEKGKHIGLASEHALPEAFKAKSDTEAGTVEIKASGKQAVDIAMNSFAAVANALAAFCPKGEATLDPGHTITISDQFTGQSVTVTAGSLIDVATVLKIFATKKGKFLPENEEETLMVSQASVVRLADKRSRRKPLPASEAPKQAKPAKSAAAAASETAAELATQGKPKKQTAADASGLPRTYEDAAGFRLERKKLALSKAGGKTVEGLAGAKSANVADGYEVTLDKAKGGKHVGWIIVENEKSWIVTGFKDIPHSKHANLTAALIRIRVSNLPQIL